MGITTKDLLGPEMDCEFGWRLRVKASTLAMKGVNDYIVSKFDEIMQRLEAMQRDGVITMVGDVDVKGPPE